jgi:hypothetical protein
MTPVHTPTLFHSWIVEPGGGAQRFSLPGSEVVYFYYPDPGDPLNAYAPLIAMAKTVMSDESLEEAQRRTFINSMSPGLAFTIGQAAEDSPTGRESSPVLTRAQRRALKTILKDEYKGVVNSGEPMLLDGFIKGVNPVFPSAKEMDYLNSSEAIKKRLAQGWGVSPANMGELQDANRASSATADDHFIGNVINPRVSMMSEVMTRWLPPFFSRRSDEVVYLQPASSKDIDWELNRDTVMFDRGAKSINEWRETHGMPPLKNGDRAFIPAAAKPGAAGDDDSGEPSGGGGGDGWVDVEIDDDTPSNRNPPGSKAVDAAFNLFRKVQDDSGHEHGADGRFGSGSGGGAGSDSKPQPHGKIDQSDEEHADKARSFMSKIKEHGAKAVKAAKELATDVKALVYQATWYANKFNAAAEICDTADDFSSFYKHRAMPNPCSEHLGVSPNIVLQVASHVLSYGMTKLKQFISKRRREDGADKGFDWLLKDDDDSAELSTEEKLKAVLDIVRTQYAGIGQPEDSLPTMDDLKEWLADQEDDDDDSEEDDEDDKAFSLPAKSVAASWGVKATTRHFREMVDVHRRDLASTITGVLSGLGGQAVAEIRKHRGHDAVNAVEHAINAAKWEEKLKDAVEDVLRQAVKTGASGEWIVNHKASEAKWLVKAGLPGRLLRALSGLVSHLLSGPTWGKLISYMVGATKDAVGRAARKGEDPGDAAASVLTEPIAVEAAAAKTADVEAAAAVNGGRHAAFKTLLESGKVIARRWMTCRDGRVRNDHRKAHGQVARGDGPFNVGGEECLYPGDPSLSAGQRCRCRCVAISISG